MNENLLRQEGRILFFRIIVTNLIIFLLSAFASDIDAHQNTRALDFKPNTTLDFTFQSGGRRLSGIFDVPADQEAEALILFVHGYGNTDVRAWDSYSDLRKRFGEIGIATAVWDKPGQGRSEGEFDINQSVYESAQEIVDAIKMLREVKAPGIKKVGIWGVSRAGWIAPIAISKEESLKFWISVSGTAAEDNFPYLLLSNLPHEGGTQEQADQLAREWRKGCEILRTGGSFASYQKATKALRANEYILKMRGNWPTRLQYLLQQKSCKSGSCEGIDNDMCSYIFVEDFDVILSSIDVDVLAIFGEKDLNVDWQKTSELYTETIGKNTRASLVTHTFEDADHNLNVAVTGSISEMQSISTPQKSDGYYEAQLTWLRNTILINQETNN